MRPSSFHKNVIENAMIISNDRILKLKPLADCSLNLQKDLKLEAVERNHIIDVLNKPPGVSADKKARRTCLD